MAAIRPYHIAVPQDKINRLQQKLELCDLPDELEDAGWNYGTSLSEVQRIAEYWKTQYRWEIVEAQLNKLPNFITTIQIEGFDPFDVQFLHKRSVVKRAIPLIFIHGCTLQTSREPHTRGLIGSTQGRAASSKSPNSYHY